MMKGVVQNSVHSNNLFNDVKEMGLLLRTLFLRRGLQMWNRKLLFAALLVGLAAIPLSRITAQKGKEIAPGQGIPYLDILGTWQCRIIRPGTNSYRPWLVQFRADGTATYSSGTNTSNVGSAGWVGLTSRSGNGDGDWEKVGSRDYRFVSTEFLYKNGNIGGRWFVDGTFHLRSPEEMAASSGGEQLCTGSITGDTCPTPIYARATKFEFTENIPTAGCSCMNTTEGCSATSPCLNNEISDEVDAFSSVVAAVIRCNPLIDVKTINSSDFVFPIEP